MEITLSQGGEYTHSAPQQKWRGNSNILQTALFAGQEMMVIRQSDDSHIFELRFMGLKTTGFTSVEAAKSAAPEFACAVLDRLKGLIVR